MAEVEDPHREFMRLMRYRELPPASALMGMRVVEMSQAEGRILMSFDPPPAFSSIVGAMHGGFIMAMLDECMGVSAIVKSGMTRLFPTAELKTSFLRPVPMGRVLGEGRVVRMGASVAFIEGELRTPAGVVLARATATSVPVPFPERWPEHCPQ